MAITPDQHCSPSTVATTTFICPCPSPHHLPPSTTDKWSHQTAVNCPHWCNAAPWTSIAPTPENSDGRPTPSDIMAATAS